MPDVIALSRNIPGMLQLNQSTEFIVDRGKGLFKVSRINIDPGVKLVPTQITRWLGSQLSFRGLLEVRPGQCDRQRSGGGQIGVIRQQSEPGVPQNVFEFLVDQIVSFECCEVLVPDFRELRGANSQHVVERPEKFRDDGPKIPALVLLDFLFFFA